MGGVGTVLTVGKEQMTEKSGIVIGLLHNQRRRNKVVKSMKTTSAGMCQASIL